MDNPSAFPSIYSDNPPAHFNDGMSLLDYFAGQALAGFCAHPNGLEWPFDEMASDAYRIARAMLAARGLKIVDATDAD